MRVAIGLPVNVLDARFFHIVGHGKGRLNRFSRRGVNRCRKRMRLARRERARTDELVDRLEMGEFLATPVRQLSLGQRMRAEVAAALARHPGGLELNGLTTLSAAAAAAGLDGQDARAEAQAARRACPPSA